MCTLTCIGSRTTPKDILVEMTKIGQWIREEQLWCRSGHAEGADFAFELGAQDQCIAYLPWASFNKQLKSKAYFVEVGGTDKHNELVNEYHPAPERLSDGARRLMARNCCQILGVDLATPSDAVICWTPQDMTGEDSVPEWKGGTGFACRMAWDRNIPIINMYEERFSNADSVIGYLYLKGIVRRHDEVLA